MINTITIVTITKIFGKARHILQTIFTTIITITIIITIVFTDTMEQYARQFEQLKSSP